MDLIELSICFLLKESIEDVKQVFNVKINGFIIKAKSFLEHLHFT